MRMRLRETIYEHVAIYRRDFILLAEQRPEKRMAFWVGGQRTHILSIRVEDEAADLWRFDIFMGKREHQGIIVRMLRTPYNCIAEPIIHIDFMRNCKRSKIRGNPVHCWWTSIYADAIIDRLIDTVSALMGAFYEFIPYPDLPGTLIPYKDIPEDETLDKTAMRPSWLRRTKKTAANCKSKFKPPSHTGGI